MRLFVGLFLPDDVVQALTDLQMALPCGRAVDPDNLHVTLAFLGDVARPVAEEVHLALSRIEVPVLSLRISGLSALPERRPRLVQADLVPHAGLSALQRKVAVAVASAGLAPERRRFRPHVTLARFSGGGATREEAARLGAFLAARGAFATGPFEVSQVSLVRSHLHRLGADYETLATYETENA